MTLAQLVWSDPAGLNPIPEITAGPPQPRRHGGRHKRPSLGRRITRAISRGIARAISWPLWPEYIVYKRLEASWLTSTTTP